jgi:hypothetical protein
MIEEPVAPIGLATHAVEEIADVAPERVTSEAPVAEKKARPRGGAKRGAAKKAAASNGADGAAKKPSRPRARKTAAKDAGE